MKLIITCLLLSIATQAQDLNKKFNELSAEVDDRMDELETYVSNVVDWTEQGFINHSAQIKATQSKIKTLESKVNAIKNVPVVAEKPVIRRNPTMRSSEPWIQPSDPYGGTPYARMKSPAKKKPGHNPAGGWDNNGRLP